MNFDLTQEHKMIRKTIVSFQIRLSRQGRLSENKRKLFRKKSLNS